MKAYISFLSLFAFLCFPYLASATDSLALQLVLKADSILKKSEYTLARAYYERAIERLKVCKKDEQYYDTKLKLYLVFSEEGFEQIALDSINKLIPQVILDLPNDSEVIANYYHKIGVLLYYMDNEMEAIKNYRKAIFIRERQPQKKWEDILQGYTNIGLCNYYLNQLDSAQYYLEKAQSQLNEHPVSDEQLKIIILRQLAIIYNEYEDLDKVVQFSQHIINYYNSKDELTRNEQINRVITYDNYGQTLSKLHQFEKAVSWFEKAVSGAENISKEPSILLGITHFNFGQCYLKMKEPKTRLAEEEFLKGLKIYQQLNAPDKIKDIYLNLGICYNEEKEFRAAIDILTPLIFDSKTSSENKYLSQIFDNLGDAYQGLNLHQKALNQYNKSIALLAKQYQEENTLYPPLFKNITIYKKGILTTLTSKAKVLTNLYNTNNNLKALKAAYAHYQTADTLIANIRQGFLAEGSKISLVAETKPIYEKAIEVSYELWQQTKEEQYKLAILNFIENSKAIALLEAVRGAKASEFAGIDNSLEKQLILEIRRIKEKIYNNPDNTLELEGQLIELELQKEKFVKELEKNHPNYFNYKFQQRPLNVSEIVAMIGDATTLLEYFIGDSTSYALTISEKEGLTIHPLSANKATLAKQIPTFNQVIYQPFANPSDTINLSKIDAVYANLGHQLYQQLIAPLNLASGQNIIIIPDETLNLLPFEALLSRQVPNDFYGYYGNQQAYDYLLYQHPTSYCYSSSLLQQMHLPTNFNSKAQLLAFHHADFSQQIDQLKGYFGWNTPFFHTLNDAATRENFQALAPQYQFLHFSTHGIMNNQEPEQSHLVLNGKVAADRPLYLSTLYNTPLQAEMVVTSACDAGIGKVSSGEGILSLARGFSYAGVRSIITSLWKIKDGPTSEIIGQFYQNLQADRSKDKALQEAKIAFIRGHGDNLVRPYYWAGFIPIGNMTAVDIPFIFPLWAKILFGIGVLTFLVLVFRFLKR